MLYSQVSTPKSTLHMCFPFLVKYVQVKMKERRSNALSYGHVFVGNHSSSHLMHLCISDGDVEVKGLNVDGARGADQVRHGGKELVVSGRDLGEGDGDGEVAEGQLVRAGKQKVSIGK